MNLLEEIKAYRDNPALNYSLLKRVIENNTSPFKSTLPMVMGSCLDILLTAPELFDSVYIVKDVKRPSGDLVPILESVFSSLEHDKSLETNIHFLVEKAKEGGYGGKTYTTERIRENILKLEDYWNILLEKENSGLEYISLEEYNREVATVEKLKKDEHTKAIFRRNPIFQKSFYGEIDIQGVPAKIKGLPDIIIPEKDRIVLIDAKRTSISFGGFRKQALNMYYHMQMALYKELLIQEYDKPVDCFWLVISNQNSRVFPIHEDDLHIGRYGARRVNNYVYSGNIQIINEDILYGFEDAIIKYRTCQELGLNHWGLESYYNKGIEPKKSIFE